MRITALGVNEAKLIRCRSISHAYGAHGDILLLIVGRSLPYFEKIKLLSSESDLEWFDDVTIQIFVGKESFSRNVTSMQKILKTVKFESGEWNSKTRYLAEDRHAVFRNEEPADLPETDLLEHSVLSPEEMETLSQRLIEAA